MNPLERRLKIVFQLCKRKQESVANLATEFGCSKRTIMRDIDILSESFPIYSERGPHGGFRIIDSYSLDMIYIGKEEIKVFEKIKYSPLYVTVLSDEEKSIFNGIIENYSGIK